MPRRSLGGVVAPWYRATNRSVAPLDARVLDPCQRVSSLLDDGAADEAARLLTQFAHYHECLGAGSGAVALVARDLERVQSHAGSVLPLHRRHLDTWREWFLSVRAALDGPGVEPAVELVQQAARLGRGHPVRQQLEAWLEGHGTARPHLRRVPFDQEWSGAWSPTATRTYSSIERMLHHWQSCSAVVLCPDRRLAVSAGLDFAYRFALLSGEPERVERGLGPNATRSALSVDGRLLLVATRDGRVVGRDLEDGRRLPNLFPQCHPDDLSVHLERWVLVASEEGGLEVWDLERPEQVVLRLREGEARARDRTLLGAALDASPSQLALAVAWTEQEPSRGDDRTVIERWLVPVDGAGAPVCDRWGLAASEDLVASPPRLMDVRSDRVLCAAKGELQLRDGKGEVVVRSWQGDATAPIARFGATHLVIGRQEGVVEICDLRSGESQALVGHRGPVRAVAVCNGSHRAASAGVDGTVRLWCLRTLRELDSCGGDYDVVAIGARWLVARDTARPDLAIFELAPAGHGERRVHALSWHPFRPLIAMVTGQALAIVRWRAEVAQLETLAEIEGFFSSVRWSRDGETVVAVNEYGEAVWLDGFGLAPLPLPDGNSLPELELPRLRSASGSWLATLDEGRLGVEPVSLR